VESVLGVIVSADYIDKVICKWNDKGDISKLFVNFQGLVKNRLGPYKIVIRCKDGYASLNKVSGECQTVFSKNEAVSYGTNCFIARESWSSYKMLPFAVYLVSSAIGDIELSKSDFVKGILM
jgi:hypothetical protein